MRQIVLEKNWYIEFSSSLHMCTRVLQQRIIFTYTTYTYTYLLFIYTYTYTYTPFIYTYLLHTYTIASTYLYTYTHVFCSTHTYIPLHFFPLLTFCYMLYAVLARLLHLFIHTFVCLRCCLYMAILCYLSVHLGWFVCCVALFPLRAVVYLHIYLMHTHIHTRLSSCTPTFMCV